MSEVVISPDFIFFCIDDKEKNKFDRQQQSLESLTIPKDI